jgi:hypothetical protein
MPIDNRVEAQSFLSAAETVIALKDHRHDWMALHPIGTASIMLSVWSPEDVARALHIADTLISRGVKLTVANVLATEGAYSILGDACAERLVPHVNVERDVLAHYNVIYSVGPRTLRALLRAGADFECAFVGTRNTPLARLTLEAHGLPTYHAQKVALLLAAGADPKDIPPGAEFKELFQCAHDLRALGTFCGSGSLENASAPAARFVRSDGDMAIVHRVRGFIDVFKALLSF